MATVLVTGANRGLGLALVRRYAADGWEVIATCRRPDAADELRAVPGEVEVHPLDVADWDAIDRLAERLRGRAIDVLVNNAAHTGPAGSGFGATDYDTWAAMLRVNAMAPMRMAEAFCDHVAASRRRVMAVISSRMGAHPRPGHVEYRSSKAAANMVVAQLALLLADRGIVAVALHPGWVATGSAASGAPLTPDDSAGLLVPRLGAVGPDDSGWFLDLDGTRLPLVTRQTEERWYGMPPP